MRNAILTEYLLSAEHRMMSDQEKNKHPVDEKIPSDTTEERTGENQEIGGREIGGREDGLDPVRYGDWEKGGRCIDF